MCSIAAIAAPTKGIWFVSCMAEISHVAVIEATTRTTPLPRSPRRSIIVRLGYYLAQVWAIAGGGAIRLLFSPPLRWMIANHMNEELLAKCSCSQCGNHIEFPLEGAGAVVACPHCGQQTQLTLEAPA